MTVIAYKNGIMAADTQATNGNRKFFGVNKVFSTPCFLIGIAGSASLIDPFLKWFLQAEEGTAEAGCTPIMMYQDIPIDFDGDDVEAVVVCHASKTVWHLDASGLGIELGIDVPTALGSGEEYALGAMAAGASASQAVEIAMQFDPYTGGKVKSVAVTVPSSTVVILTK